jgi:signal transduction histidine kinase
MDGMSFINSVLSCANGKTSRAFPKAILDHLIDYCKATAASFYSCSGQSDRAKTFHLRAVNGLDCRLYESFQLTAQSTLGRALKNTNEPTDIADISSSPHYRDRALINSHRLRRMIVLPVLPAPFSNSAPIAAICLYPSNASEESTLSNFKKLGPVLAYAYGQALEADKLTIREQILSRAMSSRDINSFLSKLAGLLKQDWNYESVSIYLHDDRAKLLRLRGTTGVDFGLDERRINVILPDDSNEYTVSHTFRTKKDLYYSGDDIKRDRAKHNDLLHHVKKSVANLVVYERIPNVPDKPIGVLRVVNRISTIESRSEPVAFSEEDHGFLRFVCSVVAIICALYNRADRLHDDVERGLHGIQASANAAKANLQLFQQRSGFERYVDKRLTFAIHDSVDHLEALSWQFQRFSNQGFSPPKQVRTKLFYDVFAKLPKFIKHYESFYGIQPGKSRIPHFDSLFSDAPDVLADPLGLLTAFRNLIENSFKYSIRGKPAYIEISWEEISREAIQVSYSDYGIGIDHADSRRIFLEGFRTEMAMRRSPTGAGLGLSQSRTLIRSMGGEMELGRIKNPTVFQITLPLWRVLK